MPDIDTTHTSVGDDTTPPTPATLDTFDLDAFLDGAVLPSKTVPVLLDRRVAAEALEVERRIADLEERASRESSEGKPTRRRAATTTDPELEAARADLDALRVRAQFAYVRVEPVNRSIRKQAVKDGLAAATGSGIDQDAYNDSVISMVARLYTADPRVHDDAAGRVLTPQQWARFADVVGTAQYEAIIEAINEVSLVGVSPDFSRPASPSPSGEASSTS